MQTDIISALRKGTVKMEKKSNKKLIIISCVALAAIIAVFGIIYIVTRPDTQVGAKTISVEIVFSEDNKKTVEINTDAEFLRGALEEKNLITGDESDYGLYITAVDGVTAGDDEWWCITKDGVMTSTGVDTTPIADGDKFELTLSTY